MFDIAWSELLLIAVVALIFIGPKELPQVLYSLGRMAAKLRRTADDFRRQFEDSVREAGYEDLHKNLQDFRSLHPANQLKDSLSRAINQDYSAKLPPVSPSSQPDVTPSSPSESKDASPMPVATEPAEPPKGSSDVAPAHSREVEATDKATVQDSLASEPSKERVAPAA